MTNLKCPNKLILHYWSQPLQLGKQPQTTTGLDREPTINIFEKETAAGEIGSTNLNQDQKR